MDFAVSRSPVTSTNPKFLACLPVKTLPSALDVKTLALLGSTSPDKIKPYGVNGHWISSNCECKYCWNKKCKLLQDNETYTPCMEALSPEEVFNKITEIF